MALSKTRVTLVAILIFFVRSYAVPHNEKKQLFICYKYFAIPYRSLLNILKPSHVTSNKNPHMFIHRNSFELF